MPIKNVMFTELQNSGVDSFENFFLDKLFDNGANVVSALLESETMRDGVNEPAKIHIMNRHGKMSEKDMLNDAIKLGKLESIFCHEYPTEIIQTEAEQEKEVPLRGGPEPLGYEDIADDIYGAIFEAVHGLSVAAIKEGDNFKCNLTVQMPYMAGYGLDEDFNIRKSDRMTLVFRSNYALDDSLGPDYSIGFKLESAFPKIDELSPVVKSRDDIMKEYNISSKQINQFKTKYKQNQIHAQEMEERKMEMGMSIPVYTEDLSK